MPLNLLAPILIGILIWLFLLTIVFWRIYLHYNKLTEGTTNTGLKPLLEELISQNREYKKDIEKLGAWCDRIEKEGSFHIQRVGLLRFNPFKDTGGDQSFILSLVDKNDTGVIISGLYSRSGLRWYAKKIKNGKGEEHELSDEEKKALRVAGEIKN
ncbi:MAG: hypothetical protein A3A51_01355 [Candidatus Levybacteria bacterium RIFCSPLOWO2_01_FULL_39_10]|nr:MAG: hypothetical protein A3A51_01355 [Candidatus Levybacteria bacterium RIFCSPLOWO2_01_FULL_39_10]